MNRMRFEYPDTHCEDIVDDYHGTLIEDPYRWLEDDSSHETAAWVAAQNGVTSAYMSRIPFREKVRERLEQLWDYPKEGVPLKKGEWYYFAKNDGLQDQAVIYRSRVIEGVSSTADNAGKAEIFLDPNSLSSEGTVALNGMSFSSDGGYCAYSVSGSGSDWAEVRVVDTSSNTLLPDTIRWVKFSIPSWSADGRGFYYSAYDAPVEENVYSGQNRFHKVFYHKLGNQQQDDKLIYADTEHPFRYFHGSESRDGKYVFVHASEGTHGAEILYRPAESSAFEVLLPGFVNDYEIVYAENGKLLLMTNRNAPNFKLISIDLDRPNDEPSDMIPERDDMPLEHVSVAGRYLMASYLEHSSSAVIQFSMEGDFVRKISLGGMSVAAVFDGDKMRAVSERGDMCTVAGFEADMADAETFYSVTSYLSPASIYRYDLRSGVSELVLQPKTGFDQSLYVTEQVFFESRDSTRVPMFITRRRDMPHDGRNTLVLYGYGGFNISHTPVFNPSVIMLLEQGGVFVDVTLRGGGEYGEKWHHAGMLEKKQNVFDDFIAAAEYLIAEGYTSADKLAIMGGSNGGLLVGACMTQRPDLFAVAVPQVGVLDMLRYHLFTIGWGWVVEYGSADDPAQFEYIYNYSPLHNLRPGVCYPATFVTTAEHDDRVVPAHSFKFAAALQRAQGCGRPTLIRIDRDAGHGAGKPTSKRIEEQADIYSFIFENTATVVNL